MIAFATVVFNELGDGVSEVTLAQRNNAVKTLFLDRTYKTLRIRVRIWRALEGQHDADTRVVQLRPHVATPFPIPIVM